MTRKSHSDVVLIIPEDEFLFIMETLGDKYWGDEDVRDVVRVLSMSVKLVAKKEGKRN